MKDQTIAEVSDGSQLRLSGGGGRTRCLQGGHSSMSTDARAREPSVDVPCVCHDALRQQPLTNIESAMIVKQEHYLQHDFSVFVDDLERDLATWDADDPILKCGIENLGSIRMNPTLLLELADRELHVFPFSEVQSCWRRLYTDASIWQAIRLIRQLEPRAESDETALCEIARLLDMSIIMAGACLREDMVAVLFARLETHFSNPEIRSLESHVLFPDGPLRRPVIQYPLPRKALSLAEFEVHLTTARPLVLLSAMDVWPALSTRPWTPSRLLDVTFSGRRLVPVELGRSYTDDGWGQRIVSFGHFLNHYLDPDGKAETMGYLAQHDLFAQIPALRNDICVPDYCYTDPPPPAENDPLREAYAKTKKREDQILNIWMGPAGTISPLHTDPYHNLLCQVVGWKYVRLYAPAESRQMFPRGMEDGVDMSNTSRVPVERVEMGMLEGGAEFDAFDDAPYVETILGPGEMLYVPVGWWHYVRSLSVSISVSFWWN